MKCLAGLYSLPLTCDAGNAPGHPTGPDGVGWGVVAVGAIAAPTGYEREQQVCGFMVSPSQTLQNASTRMPRVS